MAKATDKKPNHVSIYAPNNHPDHLAPNYVEHFEEGRDKVIRIENQTHRLPKVAITYEDGRTITYIGMPLVFTEYGAPAKINEGDKMPAFKETRL